MNVLICTGVTYLTLDSREVVKLEFGQGLWCGNRIEKSLITQTNAKSLGFKYVTTQLIHIGCWELRHQKTCSSQWKWKDQLVGSSRTLLLRTSSMNVKIFSYQMNLIGIHKIICLKFLPWRRSIGQVQIFIDASILLRADSHAYLQLSSVDMNRESMRLIEQWQIFPLDWLSTWWWTYW